MLVPLLLLKKQSETCAFLISQRDKRIKKVRKKMVKDATGGMLLPVWQRQ